MIILALADGWLAVEVIAAASLRVLLFVILLAVVYFDCK